MLVKNKNTGAVWSVTEDRAAYLFTTGDYEKVEPAVKEVKPKRSSTRKATPKDEPTESGE